MPQSSADDPPQRTFAQMGFAVGYRLTLILDPDGMIRSVIEHRGIEHFAVEAFVGKPVGGAAAGGVRGEARRAAWDERLEAARSSPAPVTYQDLRPDQYDGAAPCVSTTVTPITAVDGTLEAILVLAQDQSDLVQLERKATEQRELLQSALELTGVGSFAYYVRERRFDCDARYREIFGYDPSPEVAERGPTAFIRVLHPDDRDRVEAAFLAVVRGREGISYQEEYRIWAERPAGPELRRVRVMARLEVDEAGPRRVLGVVDDVTDRRREEELRIRMQKREALGTLAGGMAHDFNNVISAILSNAYVARAEVNAGADPSTSLAEITNGAKRAAELVSRMLDFSRDRAPERRAFALEDVAREACRLLRPTLPAGVALEVHAAPDLPPLLGDPSQLHQVVMNLVTNAGQAVPDGHGRIDVSVDAVEVDETTSGPDVILVPGRYLRLQVRDDGLGIPESEIGRIFDPFFTTKPRGQGTGLGLAAAQTIVRSHGGQITVDSLVGQGTTVTVLLPRDASQDPGPGRRPSQSRSIGRADAAARPRVLFVDDEPALVTLAERALPAQGCEVRAFTAPEDALAAVLEDADAFDALVTDLAMPGLTGFELIEAVRRIRPDIAVVLTSGFLTDESEAEATRLAVDRIVPKPCPVVDLASAVHDVVGSTER